MIINTIGIVQFSNSAILECFLTNSTLKLNLSINKILQQGLGTNTQAGLEEAKTQLLNSGRKDSLKTIILLTDGASDNSITIEKAIEIREILKIKILTIVIGNGIKQKEIFNISTPQNAFFVKNFEKLNNILSSSTIKPIGQPTVIMKRRTQNKITVEVINNNNTFPERYLFQKFIKKDNKEELIDCGNFIKPKTDFETKSRRSLSEITSLCATLFFNNNC
jgi:hypothetical protein